MANSRPGFSWRQRRNSFSYAWNGIKAILKTEHNTWIHLIVTIITLLSGWILKISRIELIALFMVIALVWITEILNTCIEKTMDFISREQHPQIKLVKDMAAAAVLIMSVIAVIIGGLIFIPKVVALLHFNI